MRLLEPLRTRPILMLWSGMSLSAVGEQFYIVALSWIAVSVFGATGPPTSFGKLMGEQAGKRDGLDAPAWAALGRAKG